MEWKKRYIQRTTIINDDDDVFDDDQTKKKGIKNRAIKKKRAGRNTEKKRWKLFGCWYKNIYTKLDCSFVFSFLSSASCKRM
jgi:hypothetical protein